MRMYWVYIRVSLTTFRLPGVILIISLLLVNNLVTEYSAKKHYPAWMSVGDCATCYLRPSLYGSALMVTRPLDWVNARKLCCCSCFVYGLFNIEFVNINCNLSYLTDIGSKLRAWALFLDVATFFIYFHELYFK